MIEMSIDFGLLGKLFIPSIVLTLVGIIMGFKAYVIEKKKAKNSKIKIKLIKISRVIEIIACLVNIFLFFEFISQFPNDVGIIAIIAIIIYLIPLMLLLIVYDNKKAVGTIYLVICCILLLQLLVYSLFLMASF